MKKALLLVFFIGSCVLAQAQKEYHKWYFGSQAGIDFVSGTATALTNGAMNSTDNPATVSDSAGNLLFYSNGVQVWNRNHQVMSNGSGLLGSNSGGHTATIVRKPGSSSVYYLFTMDTYAGSNGLRYNVIDMNLNGGLGDIVSGQKNIVLLAQASEQIVPVVHSNGTDVWLITHPWNSGSYNCYAITTAGINTVAVVSTLGATRNGNTANALGQINVNAANNKIVSVTWGSELFELFDFNNSTGVLSNPLTFSNVSQAWGAEFSPSGNKLYVTGWTTQYVIQYDLTSNVQSTIENSQINLGNVTGPGGPYYTGYMQRAPDGKIYIAVYNDPYLGVINAPDSTGALCNLVDNGFNLGGKLSGAGLPDKTVVSSCVQPSFSLGTDTSYCENFTRILTTGDANTVWSTGANGSQITVTDTGVYIATITNRCGTVADTIAIHQLPTPLVNLGNDTSICNGNTLQLNAANANATYQWQNGSTASTYNVSTSGTYSVTVTSSTSCTASDAINISLSNIQLSVTAVNTTCGFSNGVAIANVGSGVPPYTYVWSNGSTNDTIQNIPGGTYSVTVEDANGCLVAGNAAVNPSGNGAVTITTDQLVTCAIDTAEICAPTGYIAYLWNTGATTTCVSTSLPGNYYVTVTDNANCTSTSNVIALQQFPVPSISLSVNGNVITVYNTTQREWYLNGVLIQGATDSVYVVTQSGFYTVQVTDSNGCTAVSNAIPVTVTDVTDIEQSKATFYPNPAKQFLNINWNINRPFLVSVFDVTGRLVNQTTGNSNFTTVDLKEVSRGVYVVKLTDIQSSFEYMQRVVVE